MGMTDVTQAGSARRRDRLPPTTRREAFSDGVFAIAITLLVIEIHVPGEADIERGHGLFGALLRVWPQYLSYLGPFSRSG